MNENESLKILGLTKESTLKELSIVFRQLVKKYHPDLNQDKLDWSHQKMHTLNEAYNSAYKILNTEKPEVKIKVEDNNIHFRDSPKNRNVSFSSNLDLALNFLYEAMEIYYLYGLENIVLRREGSRRSHYRTSLRRIKKSFSHLKPLAEMHLNKEEHYILDIIVLFIRYVYKSMHITLLRPDNTSIYERKAFRHYDLGSKLLDSIIKEMMFKEFVESYKLGRINENIKLCEAELNSVIIDYDEAICLRETLIKKELLMTLLEVFQLNKSKTIKFFH